jgi:hypothetical protein
MGSPVSHVLIIQMYLNMTHLPFMRLREFSMYWKPIIEYKACYLIFVFKFKLCVSLDQIL